MSWLDQFLVGVKTVYSSFVQLPQRVNLAFTGSGVTVADDPTNNRTVVTISGSASGVPLPATSITTSGTSTTSVTANTIFSIETSGAAVTYSGTPPDGLALTFIDTSQVWSVGAPFVFISQAGGTVRNPGNLAGTDGGSASLSLTGASVTFYWKASKSKWLSE